MSYEFVSYNTGCNEVAARPKGSKNSKESKSPHKTKLWKKFLCEVSRYNEKNDKKIVLVQGDWFFCRYGGNQSKIIFRPGGGGEWQFDRVNKKKINDKVLWGLFKKLAEPGTYKPPADKDKDIVEIKIKSPPENLNCDNNTEGGDEEEEAYPLGNLNSSQDEAAYPNSDDEDGEEEEEGESSWDWNQLDQWVKQAQSGQS